MGRYLLEVVGLYITYARAMKVDYTRFSRGRATCEACGGNLERKNGNHLRICSTTQENQDKPLSRWHISVMPNDAKFKSQCTWMSFRSSKWLAVFFIILIIHCTLSIGKILHVILSITLH
jgi:hypothetical protein